MRNYAGFFLHLISTIITTFLLTFAIPRRAVILFFILHLITTFTPSLPGSNSSYRCSNSRYRCRRSCYWCSNSRYRCRNSRYRCSNSRYRCSNSRYRCRNSCYRCRNSPYTCSRTCYGYFLPQNCCPNTSTMLSAPP
jgi:hypothetical protein